MKKLRIIVIFMIVSLFCVHNLILAFNTNSMLSKPDKKEIDHILRGIWADMLRALANKDIEKAASYFSDETRDLYKDIFTALTDQLPQIAREMQDIEPIEIESYSAKYRMRQLEEYGGQMINMTYYIYFIVERDGTWKIYRY